MPSASTRPKPAEKPHHSPSGGDDLLNGLSDDLIDMSVGSFGDDLLDQLPAQPRVFATPAAPTAPVPPPPTMAFPENLGGYVIGDPEDLEDSSQQPPQEPQQFRPELSTEEMSPSPEYFPPQEGYTSPAHVPTQPNPGYQPPGFPGYVPTQPYPQGAPASPFPSGYPYQQYPGYQPPYYPPSPAEPAPADPNAMPKIEQTENATVLATSASLVTDSVVINSAGSPQQSSETPSPLEASPPQPVDVAEESLEIPHTFQPEMAVVEDVHLLDDYEAFPPLSEGDGEVTNVLERIVGVWIDDAIAKVRGCSCEKCRMDIAAFALNRLTPHYILTEDLSEEMVCRRQAVARTVEMVYKAAFQVKTFPRH